MQTSTSAALLPTARLSSQVPLKRLSTYSPGSRSPACLAPEQHRLMVRVDSCNKVRDSSPAMRIVSSSTRLTCWTSSNAGGKAQWLRH